ncbi:MAG: membrane protein insertion efficiency factor YidD [Solirubrobacteraceae bacterium]|nr:membrane protein insertion efficiency factor YidD [Solirubrobacteraceae bacterium]
MAEHGCADHAHVAASPDAPAARRSLGRQLVLSPVLGYRRWISPMLGPRCRFEPSCSAYAVHAVDQFGILRGLVLAVWRVARCHPLGGSGLDRAEDQRIFPLSARLKRASKA